MIRIFLAMKIHHDVLKTQKLILLTTLIGCLKKKTIMEVFLSNNLVKRTTVVIFNLGRGKLCEDKGFYHNFTSENGVRIISEKYGTPSWR